ncbi:MAG TPA: TolC family protein [Kofleriaceae bacterium]|jgi:outer membrane protein TolC
MNCQQLRRLAILGGLACAAPAYAQAPTPEVTDPMLAPPAPAPMELHSWDEALQMLRRAPDFLTSVAAVERAVAQRRIALAAVLPTLVGQGSYVHNFNTLSVPFGTSTLIVPPPTVWSATGTASWNAINPRGLYGIGTADLQIEVASLSLADRRRVLATSVVSAMLSSLAAARVAELDRVGLRAALERLVLTRTRLEFAKGTALDVDRANQDVAAARAQLIDGDESLRQSREALGEALGTATPIAVPAAVDLEGFDRAVAATCHINNDVERRADVAAARERVSIADRAITDAKLMYAPSLGVASQGGYATQATLGPNWTWDISATVTLPLYDGGARYGALRDAKAAAQQARDALTSLRISALIEVARASRAVAVDTAARDVAKQQRDLAASVDARVREGYAKGVGTSLDLVTSAQALRQAEIGLVLAEFRLAQARADAVLVDAECVY